MSGKRMNVTIVITMLVLFLACGLVVLVQRAANIRDELLLEIQDAGAQALAEFDQVAQDVRDNEDIRQRALAYQSAMVYNDDGLVADYPFRCASFVYDRSDSMAYRSRTMLLVHVVWEDYSEEIIPMTFEYENTADVAQILRSRDAVATAPENGYANFTGYWKDGLFYIRQMDTTGYIKHHESPLDPPEHVTLETIHLTEQSQIYGGTSIREVQIEALPKSYNGRDGYASFAGQWTKTDELIEECCQRLEEELDSSVYFSEGMLLTRAWDNSLLSTKHVDSRFVQEYRGPDGRSGARCVYVAQFSPLRLAMQELLKNGAVVVLMALFLCATAFLQTMYNYTRAGERRGYLDEIARQKQALEYAKGAEASRRAMTSAIAHELKTPIAVLSSYSEALQENIDAEKQSHYLAVIREETEKMDRMVLELLDLSRLEAGKYKLKREDFDLEVLAREVLVPLEGRIQEKDLHISWQVKEPMVNADRYRMGQVVTNFMTNAIRHTPPGGKIVIRIGTERETLSVENQGKQLPAAQLSQVWETFWQGDASRNEKGSGLGLSICRSIVTLHGGSCRAENTGAGVRFSVSLDAEKKLRQTSHLPDEGSVQLQYLIAQEYTTVENLLRRLELLEGRSLQRELKAGHIRVGGAVVRDGKEKLYPAYVLRWKEFQIQVCRDESSKRAMLLFERMLRGDPNNFDAFRATGYAFRKW